MRKPLILKQVALSTVVLCGLTACDDDTRTDGFSSYDEPEIHELSDAQKEVIAYTPKNAVIAHRGTEFWAPEESEAAMRWARNIGADYLECDLQRTKDGVTLALHDTDLTRTTDIEAIYPSRIADYVSSFTFEELLKLDIGSWFNEANPEQARSSFVGLDVLTLEDVIAIAEGKRIKRDADGKRVIIRNADGSYAGTEYVPDEADNGNRPGVYIETKAPWMFAGMEETLLEILTRTGWYAEDINQLKKIPYKDGKPGEVDVANTPARIILQTFEHDGLANFNRVFKRKIPTLYLFADLSSTTPQSYAAHINFAIDNGATAMGPNIDYISGYPTSLKSWQAAMIQKAGMDVHAWTFNTQNHMLAYTGPWTDPTKEGGPDKNSVDMVFTNHADLAIDYYRTTLQGYLDKGLNYFKSNANNPWFKDKGDNLQLHKTRRTAQEVLDELGYYK